MYIGRKFKFKSEENICNHLGVYLDVNMFSSDSIYTIKNVLYPHITIDRKLNATKNIFYIIVKEFTGTIYESTKIPSYYIDFIEDIRDKKIDSVLN